MGSDPHMSHLDVGRRRRCLATPDTSGASRGSEMSAFSLSKPSFGLHSCVDDHYSSSVNSKSLRGQLVLWALARDERSRGTGDHWAQLQKEAVDVRKTAGK